MNITLQAGRFGWDFIIKECDKRKADDNNTILIQCDCDYPGVARTFGWVGEDREISEALEYLSKHIGKTVDDPGYF